MNRLKISSFMRVRRYMHSSSSSKTNTGKTELKKSKFRALSKVIPVVVVPGIYLAVYLPHLYPDMVKSVIQRRHYGYYAELPKKDKAVVTQVKNDLEKKGFTREALEKMNVILMEFVAGQEPWHFGSARSRNGALIGYPCCYTFSSFEDVFVQSVGPVSLDPDSEEADELSKTFILGDNAKKFMIAREMYLVKDLRYVHVKGALFSIPLPLTYAVRFLLIGPLSLLHRQTVVIFLGVFFTATLYMCATLYDSYIWHRERSAIRAVAEMNQDYAEGGLDYYTQMIQRNKILRSCMGKYSDKAFTPAGNPRYFFLRNCHVPYTRCRDDIDSIIADKYLS